MKFSVLVSAICLGGVSATVYGASDAQAHSVRAVAAPPFLWTDVGSSQARGIATALSEELGTIHDFGPGTFLGTRFSARAPNHPFGWGVMADFDDKNEHRHSHSLSASNGSPLGSTGNDAASALDRLGGLNGPLGASGWSVAGPGHLNGNQNSQNSQGTNNQNGQGDDKSDPPDPPGAPVSSVPLPSALPLFASGLAGLGLLVWRRKRKHSTL